MSVKRTAVVLPANSPLIPPLRFQELAWAFRGLMGGEADASQQGLVLNWIVRDLCGTYDLPYRPDSSRDTDFSLGKMHVGQQIVALLNMTPEQIKALPKMGARTPEDDDSLPNM